MSSEGSRTCYFHVQDLVIRRGHRQICQLPLLNIVSGEAVWLRGRNGSGKSSVLRALAGLLPLEQGGLTAHGDRPVFLGHQNALHDELTIWENLRFQAALSGVESTEEQVKHAILSWQLTDHAQKTVRRLSQGLKRRTALARLSFAAGARCWLLDEPYDALDQASCQHLGTVISGHVDQGGAVLLTSHSRPEGLARAPTEVWMHA